MLSVCYRKANDNMCRARRPREGYSDLTVEELVAEPIVRELMRADHVDPAAFEELLCSIAARSPGRNAQSGARRRGAAWFRSVKSSLKT
jgi:hypothetical protein